MLARLRTFVIVALVTLVVWTIAESESLRTDTLRIEVALRPEATSPKAVALSPGEAFDGSVTLRAEGSTARLDKLREITRHTIRIAPGDPGFPADAGQRTVDLRTALRVRPEFRDSGVSVLEVDPPSVNVRVDDLVELEAKVRVEVPDGQLDGTPTATPAAVTLRLPRRLADSLPAPLEVIARIDADAQGDLPEGRPTTIPNVRLLPPSGLTADDAARIEPPQASVSLTLRSRTARTVIPTVYVTLLLTPSEQEHWDIEILGDHFLTDVAVTGPDDLIQQIKENRLAVKAYVPLPFDVLQRAALDAQPIERQAVFTELPTPLRFEAASTTVRLRVRPREDPPPSGSGSDPKPPAGGPADQPG